jgi:PiT family inorganic phosphate transporter
MVVALLVLVALLAFANGANDNCKGVATLVGYGAARPRPALAWAAVTTAAGAAVSFWLAGGLIQSFSTGLFTRDAALAGNHAFFIAVLAGAFGWVIFATFTGLPVSTTHAITGALTGAGLVAFGGAKFQWSFLGARFALPLAVSPVLSLAVVYLLAWPVAWVVGRAARRCVCVVKAPAAVAAPVMAGAPIAASVGSPADTHYGVVVDTESHCAEADRAVAVTTSAAADAVHWTTSGLVGFARGWNDAPKIAALALVAVPKNMGLAFAIVTVAMAAGGLLAGRKVLETLAKKVTALPLAESLTASFVSATLVGLASWISLPVSTTHVTTGGIVGAGLKHDARGVAWRKVGEIVLSWVVTLPVAALVAAGAGFLLLRW